MWKLISGLILLAVVLLGAQWWLQREGFRVSAAQRACEKAFQQCMKLAVTGDDAKLCNSTYRNCMGTPLDASGSTLPTFSSGIYGRDASGNRVLLVNPKDLEDTTTSSNAKDVRFLDI